MQDDELPRDPSNTFFVPARSSVCSQKAVEDAVDWLKAWPHSYYAMTRSFGTGGPIKMIDDLPPDRRLSPGSTVSIPDGFSLVLFAPGDRALAAAYASVRNAPLAVVETKPSERMAWAREAGAFNIATKESESSQLKSEVRYELENLIVAGNSEWLDADGERDAFVILTELHRGQALDEADVIGFMQARAVSVDGIRQLRKLIDKVRTERKPRHIWHISGTKPNNSVTFTF